MSAQFVIPSVFTAIDRFTAPMRKMGAAVNGFVAKSNIALARAERGWRTLMTPINSVNKMLMGAGYYVGLYSFIALMGSAINTMAKFEQAQINIASVADSKSLPYLKALSYEARKIAVRYGESAAAISGFQFELIKMGFTAQEAMAMTSPITTGAVANRTTPDRLQEVVGAILKSHDMPVIDQNTGQNNAEKVINQFTFAANATAAQFEDLATMLPIINRLTHKANIPFEVALAYLGQLRNVQIHTSTGATSFKNILLDLKATNPEEFEKGIKKISSAKNSTLYAFDKFGKRSVVTAVEFADSLDKIKKLAEEIKGVNVNYTANLAAKQLDSINGRIKRFKSAYQELIISIDDGSGPLGMALKNYLDVGRGILYMASGSDAAKDALSRLSPDIRSTAERYLYWLKVLKWVIITMVALKVLMIAWRVAVIAASVAIGAYNIVLGILAARYGIVSIAIQGNVIALGAYNVATWLAAGATKVFSAALWANPITWVVGAIAAMVALMYVVVDQWNDWGASLSLVMGPLGWIISLIQSFRRNWDAVVQSFSTEGFLAGIKKIGVVFYDALLMPLQQIYKLMGNLPGEIGRSSQKMAALIESQRAGLGLNVDTDESGAPLKPRLNGDVAREEFRSEINRTNLQKAQVDFTNVPWGTKITGDKNIMGTLMPSLNSTFR